MEKNMGGIRQDERNVRKLTKVGGGATYSITLPIEDVRELGWKEKQKLTVELDKKNKRFIIRDWKK
jgi:bifunctional DNA-binding transcriptional regulator/antitoxin component of YhaV-PrlF toxin-antitoxin module